MQATTYSARAAAASFGQLTASFQEEECPRDVIEQTPERRRAAGGFEQCLRDHGRDLDSGYPDQCAPSPGIYDQYHSYVSAMTTCRYVSHGANCFIACP